MGKEKPNKGQQELKGGYHIMYQDDYGKQNCPRDALVEQLPAILTPQEVMDILGVGKNTVYRLLNAGELQGFRVGRGWRITEDSLRALMFCT